MTITIADAWVQEGEAKGKAKGRMEGRTEATISVLEARFGEVPAGLRKKLLALRDSDRIEKAVRLAATCSSIKEFQKGM